ncbi:MAG TPA: AI-2E family transporter [Pyrinomonadaceae bacterium]|jgi:predicted PurR-regulated permease PerM|nr:AI-2E family transporter [Pyrinomonadaceae bacterium]
MNVQRIQPRWIALLAATAAGLYLCWLMLLPFINVLAWAAVLVVVFYPVHRRLVERTKRPATSALISCLLVIFVILLPLSLITLALVREFSHAAQGLQGQFNALSDPNSSVGRLVGWISAKLGNFIDIKQLSDPQSIQDHVQQMVGTVAQRTLGLVGGALGVVVQVFFIIFTMYYLFRDGAKIVLALPDVLPLERAQSAEIISRTRDVISASVNGVLVIAAIQGALGAVAFFALKVPSALVWGVVMTFLSLIPMAGAFIVWIPAAIFLAVTGHYVKAALLVAWGTFVIGTVDNFLRPKLVGERTKLHELFIFFSVLGGLQVFGVLGLVLGPVVLAVTLALLDVMRHVDRHSTAAEQQPSFIEHGALKDESATVAGEARAALEARDTGTVASQ